MGRMCCTLISISIYLYVQIIKVFSLRDMVIGGQEFSDVIEQSKWQTCHLAGLSGYVDVGEPIIWEKIALICTSLYNVYTHIERE